MFKYIQRTSDGTVRYMLGTGRFDSRGRHQSVLPDLFLAYNFKLQGIFELAIPGNFR